MEDILAALQVLLTFKVLAFMFAGMIAGIMAGALPGLTATMSIALLVPFTYRIEGDVLRTSRTNYNLAKSDFQKAYEMVPIKDPSDLKGLVRGSPYIWAILNDPRISEGKW